MSEKSSIISAPDLSLPRVVREKLLNSAMLKVLSNSDSDTVLAAIDTYRALVVGESGIPPVILFYDATHSSRCGEPDRAKEVLVEYFKVADEADPNYSNALRLLGSL